MPLFSYQVKCLSVFLIGIHVNCENWSKNFLRKKKKALNSILKTPIKDQFTIERNCF